LHVHGRGARTDACGRSIAVLSTQVSTVDLRLRLVVPRTMPAAVASRCCGRRFQQLVFFSGKMRPRRQSVSQNPQFYVHVCARARLRLRARFTRAPIVTSDLFSRPLSCISGTQSSPRV
jgi:hypothetical protein